jgi:hypothetical protein
MEIQEKYALAQGLAALESTSTSVDGAMEIPDYLDLSPLMLDYD